MPLKAPQKFHGTDWNKKSVQASTINVTRGSKNINKKNAVEIIMNKNIYISTRGQKRSRVSYIKRVCALNNNKRETHWLRLRK